MAHSGIRVHVRVTQEALDAIDEVADEFYEGNRSQAISDAIIEFAGRAPIVMRKERKRLARDVYEFILAGGNREHAQ